MKYTLIILFFVITNSLSLGTFKNGLLIDPNTNKPFTGNLEVLNNDWGNDSVEFSKDYFEGVLHGIEKSYYKSGVLRSVGKFNMGLLEGDVIGYREDGSVYVVGHYEWQFYVNNNYNIQVKENHINSCNHTLKEKNK